MSLFCESRTRERREADEGWDQEDPTLPMVGLITINIIITSSINGHTHPKHPFYHRFLQAQIFSSIVLRAGEASEQDRADCSSLGRETSL